MAERVIQSLAAKRSERIDFRIERDRHHGFVGRTALLARLDQLLVADRTDRWVVVTGGPGMGKSAILARWLALREAAGAGAPHHFIRRGEYDWDDPAKLAGSLVAQIEERFPGQREPPDNAQLSPAARLVAMLTLVSANELAPHNERLVVLIDGFDEYDPPPGTTGDPLTAFLPHALPAGVSFLCASRPHHPYLPMLKTRAGAQAWIDLDAPDAADDNTATVRSFWDRAAPPLGLNAAFVDEAVARAAGNLQHAVMLQKHLEGLPAQQRRVESLPEGLEALLVKSWERIATDPVAVAGLGILCAAREALTLDEIGAVAGWTSPPQRSAFLHGARELLVESRRADDQRAYRLHHESIRAQIALALGPAAIRRHHAELARQLATWPPPGDAEARQYALRYALTHRVEASDWAGAWRLAADMDFLEVKCREVGAHDTEADVARAAARCRASGVGTLTRRFDDLVRALVRESHWLRRAPEAAAALVWNRLRRLGWSVADLDEQLQVLAGAKYLRVRHAVTRESPALIRDLIGHSKPVTACAITPDGRRAVSVSEDKTLMLWDLDTGRALATLEGHTDWMRACAVTPDGRQVVSASDDKTLRHWDLDTSRVLAILEGHTGPVAACAVTPDGQRMISASEDRTIKVWDLGTGHVLATLEGYSHRMTACVVTPDGLRVASASWDRTLRLWDLQTGHVLATFEGHAGCVTACVLMPDGRRLLSASEDRTLKLWDLDTGRGLATLEGHTGWVNACAVTPDGRRAVSASDDKSLKLWDLDTGRVLATLEGHTKSVTACAVTPDGRRAVSASDDKSLKLWDLDAGCMLTTLEGHTDWVRACAATADGRRVVSASADTTLRLWNLDTGRVRAALKGHTNYVNACALTPDGRHAISASHDHTLKLWDLDTGRVLATLEGHNSQVTACVVTSDGRRVVSASDDRTLKLWDLDARHVLATFEGHTGPVAACAVTPDGRRVVSASHDHTLKLWDLDTGRALATLEGHIRWVTACAVTPDGRHVVSASDDHTLKLWDLDTGRVVATFDGHTGWVRACALTPDGRRVVSASDDKTLKLWDLDTRACRFTHRGDAAFRSIAATETAVIAGDIAGTVWFLDLPPSIGSATRRSASGSDDDQRGSLPAHAIRSPRPSMHKHTILFLAANPLGTDRLALDREARAIQVELERSGHRDQFELVTRWAAEPLDLLRELRKLRPTVVHFSGHGGHLGPGEPGTRRPGAPHRDIMDGAVSAADAGQSGLFFQGPDGRPQLVSTAALQDTFGAAGSSVRLVVLNACYSDMQAEALLAHVDCVVGMSGSIGDDAARSFAIGFYGGLGERESVAAAYKQGRAAISLEALRDGDRPQLRVRDAVDADQLVLAIAPSAGAPATSAAAARPASPAASSTTPRMTRDELLGRLLGLLPSQFDVVLFRAQVPPEYLAGSHAAQATRAMDAIRYLEQQDKLEQLARALEDVVAPGNAGGRGRGGAADPR